MLLTNRNNREKPSSSQQPASGRVVVENNSLSATQQKSRSEELVACGNNSSCKASVREQYAKEFDKVQEQLNSCLTAKKCVAVAKEMKQWQANISACSIKHYPNENKLRVLISAVC
ncbi:hypothetical protein [Escherichia coli]